MICWCFCSNIINNKYSINSFQNAPIGFVTSGQSKLFNQALILISLARLSSISPFIYVLYAKYSLNADYIPNAHLFNKHLFGSADILVCCVGVNLTTSIRIYDFIFAESAFTSDLHPLLLVLMSFLSIVISLSGAPPLSSIIYFPGFN